MNTYVQVCAHIIYAHAHVHTLRTHSKVLPEYLTASGTVSEVSKDTWLTLLQDSTGCFQLPTRWPRASRAFLRALGVIETQCETHLVGAKDCAYARNGNSLLFIRGIGVP